MTLAYDLWHFEVDLVLFFSSVVGGFVFFSCLFLTYSRFNEYSIWICIIFTSFINQVRTLVRPVIYYLRMHLSEEVKYAFEPDNLANSFKEVMLLIVSLLYLPVPIFFPFNRRVRSLCIQRKQTTNCT